MMNNEKITKFKLKLYKHFTETKDFNTVEEIKEPFLMSTNNIFGIEIKNDILKNELLPFFNKNTTNSINLSFIDEKGSYFDIQLLKYCIDLINIFQNKNSVKTQNKMIYINSGNNKPIILENKYIKIYLCNVHCENYY